jgi:hypothetical protein
MFRKMPGRYSVVFSGNHIMNPVTPMMTVPAASAR